MNKKDLALLGTLFLVSTPTLAQSDCAEAKERYWTCIRASVTNHPCKDSDNVAIPAECLIGSSEAQEKSDASKSDTNTTDSQKADIPSHYEPELIQRKTVEVLNIKALHNKPYIETEDEANQFSMKIRENLIKAIKEGKKVRLQFD